MLIEDITKEFIYYLIDELVRSPSTCEADDLPLIPRSLAFKFSNMYLEEVVIELKRLGIEPLGPKYLIEKLYALYEGGVAILGHGLPGELYVEKLADERVRKNITAMLHTHPVPLPIPTPEDILSAKALGYYVECVASRIDKRRTIVTCVAPSGDWLEVMEALKALHNEIFSVRRFVVVSLNDNIVFLPYPSPREVNQLRKAFEDRVSKVATIVTETLNAY